MEPFSAIVASYASDKLTSAVEGLVRKHVIERWTRKRAIEFYRMFCQELLLDDLSQEDLVERIDELLADEARSEIVFEAYRLVCLSRSRVIGPRIIAVLVAEIVQRDGVADRAEETILELAESMSDEELEDFGGHIAKLQISQSGPTLIEVIDTQTFDSGWPSSGVETASASLAEIYGSWAHKLGSLGLISQSVRQSQHHYYEDSERHIDEDGVVTKYVFSATFYEPCMRLAALINKVTKEPSLV